MTSYNHCSKLWPDLGFDLVILDRPRRVISLILDSQIWFYRTYDFGDIVIFILLRFRLKLPIHAHFVEF